jgi:hypothetical protein
MEEGNKVKKILQDVSFSEFFHLINEIVCLGCILLFDFAKHIWLTDALTVINKKIENE